MPKGIYKRTEEQKEKLKVLKSLGKVSKIKKNCQFCSKEYFIFPSQEIRTKFCGKVCLGKSKKGNKKSESFIEKVSGINSFQWKTDRSLIKGLDKRNNPEYKQWRKQVWLRDNFTCKIANPDCKGKIEVHHILGWSQYPELRYKVNNGITLCHAHHPRGREEEAKLSPFFQSLVTEMQ